MLPDDIQHVRYSDSGEHGFYIRGDKDDILSDDVLVQDLHEVSCFVHGMLRSGASSSDYGL
jgi:hypothetical protein